MGSERSKLGLVMGISVGAKSICAEGKNEVGLGGTHIGYAIDHDLL
jgi:hypothetical protein